MPLQEVEEINRASSVINVESHAPAVRITVRFALPPSSPRMTSTIVDGVTINSINPTESNGNQSGTRVVQPCAPNDVDVDQPQLPLRKKRKLGDFIDLDGEEAHAAGIHVQNSARPRRNLRTSRSPSSLSKDEVQSAMDSFNRMLSILEKEVVLSAAKLAKDPAKMKLFWKTYRSSLVEFRVCLDRSIAYTYY